MFIVWGTLKTETFLRYKLQTTENHAVLTPQNEIIWGTTGVDVPRITLPVNMSMPGVGLRVKSFSSNDKEIRIPRKVNKNMNLEKKLLGEYKSQNPDATKEQIAEYKKIHIDPKTTFTDGTIPTCIWEKNNHTTSKDYCGWHPTTKNLEIMERIVRGYTLEGDTVLDIFMGSGSTAIDFTKI